MRRLIIRVIMACGAMAAPLLAPSAQAAPLLPPVDEYAFAEQAFAGGEIKVGLKALERAAGLNSLRAQIRLAHIYNEGTLVTRDEFRACKLYSEAASSHARIDPKHPLAKLVGEAYRNWAKCYVKGLPQPGWTRNMNAAAELYFNAGIVFGDVPGLYELALLYLSGQGVSQNIKLGIDHLYITSRKRYSPALARLGYLMWEGRVMKRRPSAGVALLILAQEGCSSEDRAWISSLYEDVMITTSHDEEAEAKKLAAEWRPVYGPLEPASRNKALDLPSVAAQTQDTTLKVDSAAGEQQRSSFGTLATGVSSQP